MSKPCTRPSTHLELTNPRDNTLSQHRLTRSSSSKSGVCSAGSGVAPPSANPPPSIPATGPGTAAGAGNHSWDSGSSLARLSALVFSPAAAVMLLLEPPKAALKISPSPALTTFAAGAEELLLAAVGARRRTVVVVDVERRARCLTRGRASGCASSSACSRGTAQKLAASKVSASAAAAAVSAGSWWSRRSRSIGVLVLFRERQGVRTIRPKGVTGVTYVTGKCGAITT